MCTMSLHTCVQECASASQWNRRSHSDTCQRTLRHSVTSLHVLSIDDEGDTQTLSPHVSECFHTRTQVARHVERFASHAGDWGPQYRHVCFLIGVILAHIYGPRAVTFRSCVFDSRRASYVGRAGQLSRSLTHCQTGPYPLQSRGR